MDINERSFWEGEFTVGDPEAKNQLLRCTGDRESEFALG